MSISVRRGLVAASVAVLVVTAGIAIQQYTAPVGAQFIGGGFVPPTRTSATGTAAATNVQSENLRLTWTAGANGTPILTDLDDWRRSSHWLDDFANAGVTQSFMTFGGTGTGATVVLQPIADGAVWRPSVAAMTTGTTTTGRYGVQTSGTIYTFGADTQITYLSIRLPVLSTVGDEYALHAGFGDTMTAVAQVDGAGFVYDRLNGGDYWRITVASNSVRSSQTLDGADGTVSTPVVAGDWNNFRIRCRSARCDFDRASPTGAWVNVGSACTAASGCTLNSIALPSGAARLFGVLTNTIKSAGTTGITTHLDFMGYYGSFNSSPVTGRSLASGVIAKTFGGARPTTIATPTSYDVSPTRTRPLILLLHSYTSTGSAFAVEYFGSASALANHTSLPNGAFVLAPTGNTDGGGEEYWNASTACCDEDAAAPDDDAYLAGLIDDVIAAGYPVDASRVWIIGRSNGSFMAHRLACGHSDKITAIVSVHGAGPNGTDYEPGPVACAPANSVHMMHWHGSADTTVPFAGGAVTAVTGMADAPSAAETASGWATRNGCTGALASYGTALNLDSAGGATGDETQPAAYAGCPADGEVEFWTMTGSTHNMTLVQPTWATTILDWLQAHPR